MSFQKISITIQFDKVLSMAMFGVITCEFLGVNYKVSLNYKQ